MDQDFYFSTVRFGGFDKKEVLERLKDLVEDYEEQIEELNIKIAQITEQVLTLRNLNGKGAIDPAFYISELNRHDNEVMKLRAIKSEILHNSQYDDIISKTRMLASEMETEKALAEFNEDKFKKIISRIEIDGKIIAFILVNGMEFTITKEEVL